MAGAQYLILSLWQIPDQQTQEMMSNFYKYLSKGIEVSLAFEKAQNDIKRKYRKIKGGVYAWSGFILIF